MVPLVLDGAQARSQWTPRASKGPYIMSNQVDLNTMGPLELDGTPGQEPVGP